MEVMVAVQSGTPLHALRVQLKRRVSARRGGDYNEVPQAIQKKESPILFVFFCGQQWPGAMTNDG